ncbi:MAG: hypothetical protein V3S45_06490 [Kiloniellales bacterium]
MLEDADVKKETASKGETPETEELHTTPINPILEKMKYPKRPSYRVKDEKGELVVEERKD